MDTSKIIVAGLVGGIAFFILGYLVWGLALAGLMEQNVGSATGVARSESEFNWITMILGNISMGLLLAVIFGRWAGISTFATGAKAGAIIGLLMGAANDLIMYSTTNIMNLTGVIVDIIAMTIVTAIVGGVVALMLGRGAK